MMLKNAFKLILLGSFLLSVGCARTVEEKSKILDLNVRLTFNGPVDLTRFRYYVILSPTPISLPALSDIQEGKYYFPTPGKTFDESNSQIIINNGINYYYQNFFSTWSDYIVIGPGLTARHYPSLSTTFDATTTNNARYQTNNNFAPILSNSPSNTLNLRFSIQSLSPQFERIYFKFVVTKIIDDDTNTGTLQEVLDDFSLPIEAKLGSTTATQRHTSPYGGVPPEAQLISWEVNVL